jgi:transmembrane sensor
MSAPDFFHDEQECLESEAVTWVVRLTSGEATEGDAHAMAVWRRQSPAHEDAFQKTLLLWRGMEGLRQDLVGEEHLFPESVRLHPTRRAAGIRSTHSVGLPAWTTWGAVAAALAAFAIMLTLQSGLVTRLQADYRTGTGEQATTTLEDGSVLQLNTQAAVAVHYTDTTRRVDLLDGEAVFRVMKDAARPFLVQAQNGQVRAVGTEFLVKKTTDGTLVTVLEGVVEVHTTQDGQASGASVRVEAGQHVRYGPTFGVGPVERADLRLATAWQRGKLIFESAPLGTVIEEINRYRPGRIVLLSSGLSGHPVSGVFDLDRLDSAVATIEHTLPVKSVRLTDRFVLFR